MPKKKQSKGDESDWVKKRLLALAKSSKRTDSIARKGLKKSAIRQKLFRIALTIYESHTDNERNAMLLLYALRKYSPSVKAALRIARKHDFVKIISSSKKTLKFLEGLEEEIKSDFPKNPKIINIDKSVLGHYQKLQLAFEKAYVTFTIHNESITAASILLEKLRLFRKCVNASIRKHANNENFPKMLEEQKLFDSLNGIEHKLKLHFPKLQNF